LGKITQYIPKACHVLIPDLSGEKITPFVAFVTKTRPQPNLMGQGDVRSVMDDAIGSNQSEQLEGAGHGSSRG
jgi:hypothetical protein